MLALLLSVAGPAISARAQSPEDGNFCSRLLQKVKNATRQWTAKGKLRSVQSPRTLDDLARLFTSGFLPDLAVEEQRQMFAIYRTLYFGDPLAPVSPKLDDELLGFLKANPDLQKEPFPDAELFMVRKRYPLTDPVREFVKSQKMAMGQVHARLFRIQENPKPWKEILGYHAATDGEFREFLGRSLPSRFLDPPFKDDLRSGRNRAEELFDFLWKLPKTPARNQLLVDLVHTVGYHDPALKRALGSEDGLERIRAYRKILDERDVFCSVMGIKNGFGGLMRDLTVAQATGTHSEAQIQSVLGALENELFLNAGIPEVSQRTIRHLSLLESPYRGCLGGDCSTRMYPILGLDPDFHYFTLTDQNGHSTGQVTVALGTGVGPDGGGIKVAFLDKIQGVTEEDLAPMIEGIRQSVASKGYVLALSRNLSEDQLKITNDEYFEYWIKKRIRVKDALIRSFRLRTAVTNFRKESELYSRAFKKFSCHEVLPLQESPFVTVRKGEAVEAWNAEEMSVEHLFKFMVELKNGSPSEQIKYIALGSQLRAGKIIDPDVERTLDSWLRDPAIDFRVRKQSFLALWIEQKRPLLELLDSFSLEQQVVLVQNILDTPRYLGLILEPVSNLPGLLVRFRKSSALVSPLTKLYLQGSTFRVRADDEIYPVLAGIPDHAGIDASRAEALLRQLRVPFRSQRSADFVAILNENWPFDVREDLFRIASSVLFWNWEGDPYLIERGLSDLLLQENPAAFELGQRILNRVAELTGRSVTANPGFPAVALYRRILNRTGGDQQKFLLALGAWLENPRVPAPERASFLLGLIGAPKARMSDWRARLAGDPAVAVGEHLAETTALPVFDAIAKEAGAEARFLENGSRESLAFFRVNGQAFQVQGRTVTELQWRLVMGEKAPGIGVPALDVLTGVRVACPRIAEVSWEEIREFLERLNAKDARYRYRLPTAEEQELLVRSGETLRLPERVGRFEAGNGAFLLSEWIENPGERWKNTRNWRLGFRLVRIPR